MERIGYSTTGTLRTTSPRIETSFGTMAYWQSLNFIEHGWTSLGGFEPPYDGQPGADRTITVNRVEYSGSITVFLDRDGGMRLDYSAFHPKGDWRGRVTDAAIKKLEAEFMPLARKHFPIPTRENIAEAVFSEASSSMYSHASTGIHKISGDTYHDARKDGYAEDIRAGVLDGLERVKDSAARETFEVLKY